jgi:uncharacterized protein YoxC
MRIIINLNYCIMILSVVIFNHTFGQNNESDNFILNTNSIMRLTMDNSEGIRAANQKLESAKYNFKLFESEYTQFTPLKVKTDAFANNDDDYIIESSVGLQKEFFDGSSISALIGNRNTWGDGVTKSQKQFLETEIQFPLFSSNRKLNRIIKRTFEENELYSAHLEYVNIIRQTIKNALEMYYDYIPRAKILKRMKKFKEDLIELKNSDALQERLTEQEQLEGEINSLTSDIQGREMGVQSLLISLERWLGINNFIRYNIKTFELEFSNNNYFGEYYVVAPLDDIFEKAINNDTDLKVLELIKSNAVEKKRLAEKGDWDIFLSLGGQYNFQDRVDAIDYAPYYQANLGIEIKRFDSSILENTIQKAEADIQEIKTTILDRRRQLSADITRKKATLLTYKNQVLSSRNSLDSWQSIHGLKKKNFLEGSETVDNYIQSLRSLINTMVESLNHENNYLDAIRDFDYIGGEYFDFLGIQSY